MLRPTYCIPAKFTAYCGANADGAAWQTLPETNTRQRSQQGSAQLGYPPIVFIRRYRVLAAAQNEYSSRQPATSSGRSKMVCDSCAEAAVSTGSLADAGMAHGAGLTSAPLRRVHYRKIRALFPIGIFLKRACPAVCYLHCQTHTSQTDWTKAQITARYRPAHL